MQCSEIIPKSDDVILELGEDTTLVQPEGLDLLKQFEMFVSIKIKN